MYTRPIHLAWFSLGTSQIALMRRNYFAYSERILMDFDSFGRCFSAGELGYGEDGRHDAET